MLWWTLFFLIVSLLSSLHRSSTALAEETVSTVDSSYNEKEEQKQHHHRPLLQQRPLPSKVIMGYTSQCYDEDPENNHVEENNKVLTAVQQGVNVVIWAFYPHFNTSCIQRTIQELDDSGYDDVVHLSSLGGWNGQHLHTDIPARDYYTMWKGTVGNIFHGLDIDFEGNDVLTSPLNFISEEELDLVGELILLAKADDYILTIAPPQSYFDIHTSQYSPFLNLTDPTRTSWHADFSYFGRNVYAYWMAKYGDAIDLVMIQFYESYSKAAMAIIGDGTTVTPEDYLQQYVWDLNQSPEGPGWSVDFDGDGTLQFVSVPLSKLVWGLCNGWCHTDNGGRHYYFSSEILNAAYQNLWDWMLEPRGFMFWEIADEGMQGIYYARGLNSILHVRGGGGSEDTMASVVEPGRDTTQQ